MKSRIGSMTHAHDVPEAVFFRARLGREKLDHVSSSVAHISVDVITSCSRRSRVTTAVGIIRVAIHRIDMFNHVEVVGNQRWLLRLRVTRKSFGLITSRYC